MTDKTHDTAHDQTAPARNPIMRPIGTDLRVEVIAMLPTWSLVRVARAPGEAGKIDCGPFWMRSGRLSTYSNAAVVLRQICA